MSRIRLNRLAAVAAVPALLAGFPVSPVDAAPRSMQQDDAGRTEARALMERVEKSYRSLTSYRDVVLMTQELTLEEGSPDAMGLREMIESMGEQKTSLEFAARDRFALRSPNAQINALDGTITIASEELGQYRQFPMPTGSLLGAFESDMVAAEAGQHPAFALLVAEPAETNAMVKALRAARAVRRTATDKGEMLVIDSALELPGMDGAPELLPLEVTVDAANLLIRRITLDLTGMMQKQIAMMMQMQPDAAGEAPRIASMKAVLAFRDVRTNEPIAAEALALSLDDLEKVDQFDFGFGMDAAMPEPLPTGEPAPAFSADTLDGGTLALADLRGKVVVLDFWGDW